MLPGMPVPEMTYLLQLAHMQAKTVALGMVVRKGPEVVDGVVATVVVQIHFVAVKAAPIVTLVVVAAAALLAQVLVAVVAAAALLAQVVVVVASAVLLVPALVVGVAETNTR